MWPVKTDQRILSSYKNFFLVKTKEGFALMEIVMKSDKVTFSKFL